MHDPISAEFHRTAGHVAWLRNSLVDRRSAQPMPSTADAVRDVLARNIRAWRVVKRLTQDELAQSLRDFGVPTFTRQALGTIEVGHRRLSAAELVGVGNALGVDVLDLLDPNGLGCRP